MMMKEKLEVKEQRYHEEGGFKVGYRAGGSEGDSKV